MSQQDPTQPSASTTDSFAPADPAAGYGHAPGQTPSGQLPYGQPGHEAAPGYPPSGYPQPGYPYQQPAYGYAPQRPTNGLAIASLVASILGFVMVPLVGSIAGVVLGHMARKAIRESGEGGDGMAVAGLVIGYIALGLWVLLGLVFLVPFFFAVAGSV